MKRITKPDLYNKTERELDGLTAEFETAIAVAEEERREAQAILQDVRFVRSRKPRPEP